MLTLLTCCLSALTVSAVTLEADRRHSLPAGWTVLGTSPRTTTIELAFAVKNTNVVALEKHILGSSTPLHPRYGQHLTNKEVHDLVAPKQEHVEAVQHYFQQHGATAAVCKTSNCDWIVGTVTVAQAEAMVGGGAHYQELHHEEGGHVIHRLRTSGYQVPAHIAAAIDLVAPTVHVPTVRVRVANQQPVTSPDGLLNVPSVLRKQYSMTNADQGASTGRKQAVTGFLGQTYSESSLQAFYKLLCNGTTCGQDKDATKVVCKGDKCAGGGGSESMLDIEYINAMVS